jgi:hypothetical protein
MAIVDPMEIRENALTEKELEYVRRFPKPGTRLYRGGFPLSELRAVAMSKSGVEHFAKKEAVLRNWAERGWPNVRTMGDLVEHYTVHNPGATLTFKGPQEYDARKMVGRPVLLGVSFDGPWRSLDGTNRMRGALLSKQGSGWVERKCDPGETMPVVVGINATAQTWADWG